MTRSRLCAVGLTLVLLAGCAGRDDEFVTVSPEYPTHGDRITITYNAAAPEARLADADSLELVLHVTDFRDEVIPMTRRGDRWRASYVLDDTTVTAVAFYFQSVDETDQANDTLWAITVYDAERQPVRGANARHADLAYTRFRDHPALDSIARSHLEKELAAFPGQPSLLQRLWWRDIDSGADEDSVKAVAAAFGEEHYLTAWDDPEALRAYRNVISFGGNTDLSSEIEERLIEIDPTGREAAGRSFAEARDEADPELRAEKLQAFIDAFPSSFNRNRAFSTLRDHYYEAGDIERAIAVQDDFARRQAVDPRSSHLGFARRLLEDGHLDEALRFVERAEERRPDSPTGFYATMEGPDGLQMREFVSTRAERRKQAAEKEAEIIIVRAEVLHARGETDEALNLMADARKKAPEYQAGAQNIASFYLDVNMPDSALAVFATILDEKPADEKAREGYEKAYVAVHGSSEGLDAQFAAFEEAWTARKYEHYAEMLLDDDAPPFRFVSLYGDPIDKEDLKGKVVVLDFWASWCGPCLNAFPHFDRAYRQWQDHPDVEFLAVNTSWSNTIEDARTFAAENEYVFPYAFDEDAEWTKEFNIRGIPTTILLGPDGRVKFRHMGFGPGQDLVSELSLQIEMLLEQGT